MCRNYAKKTGILFLLLIAAAITGAVLFLYTFISLWWEFPRTWQPLEGLNSAPQAILAMNIPAKTILLRTVDTRTFVCDTAQCSPADSPWALQTTQEIQECTSSDQPIVTTLFPLVLSWDIQTALGCERGYQSTGRAVYVVANRQGQSYIAHEATAIPTDAAVVIVALIGGMVGFFGSLIALGLIALMRWLYRRFKTQTPAAG